MFIGIGTDKGLIYVNTDNIVIIENITSILTEGSFFKLTKRDFEKLKKLLKLDTFIEYKPKKVRSKNGKND